jgi:death-on-curing protein
MATFLVLNGVDVTASIEEQERLILSLAAGVSRREDLVAWLKEHTKNLDPDSAV